MSTLCSEKEYEKTLIHGPNHLLNPQTMHQTTHRLSPGVRLENCQIRQVLGAGGFGITYLAIDMTDYSQVAIKEYFPVQLAMRVAGSTLVQLSRPQDAAMFSLGLQQFLNEARLLSEFSEPNLIKVKRTVEENGSAYIIMRYEAGISLHQYLMRCGKLTEIEIRQVFHPLLQTLQALHDKQCLHRDIKPPNILLRSDGSPVLLDFGATHDALLHQEADYNVQGTYDYAPYEMHTQSEPQGPWTDLYSLGATLYQCMTGEVPATALDRIAATHAGRRDPLLPVSLACKEQFNPLLLAIVDRMLQLDSKQRPQSAWELLSTFKQRDNNIMSNWQTNILRKSDTHILRDGTVGIC